MSFILDALKKVERERARARHPLLDLGGAPPSGSRRLWPWAVAAALAANAVVAGIVVWRWSPEPAAPDPVVASTPAPEAVPPARPERLPSRPAGDGTAAPESSRPETRSPQAAPAPRAPRTTREGPTPAAATAATVATPDAPTAATAPAAPATPGAPPAQPSPSPAARALESPATPTRHPVEADAPAPRARVARPEPPPAGPEPARAEQAGPATARSASSLSSAFRAEIENLKLEVLLYAESAADRMVFINGRKYVEGQRIGDRVAVERITAEGAVLAHEGQRFLLTPAR